MKIQKTQYIRSNFEKNNNAGGSTPGFKDCLEICSTQHNTVLA